MTKDLMCAYLQSNAKFDEKQWTGWKRDLKLNDYFIQKWLAFDKKILSLYNFKERKLLSIILNFLDIV